MTTATTVTAQDLRAAAGHYVTVRIVTTDACGDPLDWTLSGEMKVHHFGDEVYSYQVLTGPDEGLGFEPKEVAELTVIEPIKSHQSHITRRDDGPDFAQCGNCDWTASSFNLHLSFARAQAIIARTAASHRKAAKAADLKRIASRTQCRDCWRTIEKEGRLWVDVVSGDDDGTYDFCDSANTVVARHAPVKR